MKNDQGKRMKDFDIGDMDMVEEEEIESSDESETSLLSSSSLVSEEAASATMFGNWTVEDELALLMSTLITSHENAASKPDDKIYLVPIKRDLSTISLPDVLSGGDACPRRFTSNAPRRSMSTLSLPSSFDNITESDLPKIQRFYNPTKSLPLKRCKDEINIHGECSHILESDDNSSESDDNSSENSEDSELPSSNSSENEDPEV